MYSNWQRGRLATPVGGICRVWVRIPPSPLFLYFYEVLDAENVLITATNGKQSFMRFVKNTGELKFVNSTGDIYSYVEAYYEKK